MDIGTLKRLFADVDEGVRDEVTIDMVMPLIDAIMSELSEVWEKPTPDWIFDAICDSEGLWKNFDGVDAVVAEVAERWISNTGRMWREEEEMASRAQKDYWL